MANSRLYRVRGPESPNDQFYRVDVNVGTVPSIDEKTYKLIVDGQVNKELSLSYAELRNMPPTNHYATLECISTRLAAI